MKFRHRGTLKTNIARSQCQQFFARFRVKRGEIRQVAVSRVSFARGDGAKERVAVEHRLRMYFPRYDDDERTEKALRAILESASRKPCAGRPAAPPKYPAVHAK